MKKGLCISGGGALGAWGGGVAEMLYTSQGHKGWDVVIGTSTGSLLAPLVALGDFDRLRKFYTSVTQKSIFKINPFTSKGKINLWNAAWRMIRGKQSLGDSSPLRKLIGEAFTVDDFFALNMADINVIVTVVNATKKQIEYKSVLECEYEDFCDWIYASASVPGAMSEFKKDGCIYWDGGVMEHTPLNHCVQLGCNEIDVIIHRVKGMSTQNWQPKNLISTFIHVIDTMQYEIAQSDLTAQMIYDMEAFGKVIRTYFLPYALATNSLMFDQKQMNEWWALGLNYREGEAK